MPDVTFLSDRFSDRPIDDAINEMLGHDLAQWLHDELQLNYEVDEVIAEDYGFGFWLQWHNSYYWITATQYEPSGFNEQIQPKWLIGIHYDPGCLWMRRLRHRPDANALTEISYVVNQILQVDTSITQIKWWMEGLGNGEPTTLQ